MERLNDFYFEVKPIVHAYIFEMKRHKKKFIIFSIITILMIFLLEFLIYASFPDFIIPDTQIEFFDQGLSFTFILITLLGACFFFSGIICSEYSEKTGFIVFPKINKYKLIAGKYLGNLTLYLTVIIIFYFTLGLIGYYYYGGPIPIRYYLSLGIALLYAIALSSFVTLFSSLLKSENMTIILTIMILLIGFEIADQIMSMAAPDVEPLYSLDYLSGLITIVLYEDFPDPRYEEFTFGNTTFRFWITPTLQTGIIMFLVYTIGCLSLASLIFKRKQL